MRLDHERPSANVEDRRGQSGFGNQGGPGRGIGFPGSNSGRRINFPVGSGRGGLSLTTIVVLVIIYFALKLIFGVDLLEAVNGGTRQETRTDTPGQITVPNVPIGNNEI